MGYDDAPGGLRLTLLLPLLAGCFTPAADALVVETLHYETDYTIIEDLVIQPFTYDLMCPDGEPASFFAVYQESLTEPAPLAVVFHSGAFDYVLRNQSNQVLEPDDPDAVHYQGDLDRMNSSWASEKVFETLGLLGESLDVSEVDRNLGTLPAALAEAGAVALYPANCWADLWHNEIGSTPNRYNSDGGVERNGRVLAYAMTAIASSDPDTATAWKTKLGLDALPVPLDLSGVYLAGLGEGGRAVAELYRRDVEGTPASPVKGILVDSTMDNLYPIVTADSTYKSYNDGLARIYPDDEDDDGDGVIDGDLNGVYRDDIYSDIGGYSLARVFTERALTIPMAFYYSSSDPALSSQTINSVTDAGFVETNAAWLTVEDLQQPKHIFVNSDMDLAREAVSILLGG